MEENLYEPINEYDEDNNLIYRKDHYGFEQWWTYDEDGKISYYKNSAGVEMFANYDENGSKYEIKTNKEGQFTYGEIVRTVELNSCEFGAK